MGFEPTTGGPGKGRTERRLVWGPEVEGGGGQLIRLVGNRGGVTGV